MGGRDRIVHHFLHNIAICTNECCYERRLWTESVQLNHVLLSIAKQSSGIFFGRCGLFDCWLVTSIVYVTLNLNLNFEANSFPPSISRTLSIFGFINFFIIVFILFFLHSFISAMQCTHMPFLPPFLFNVGNFFIVFLFNHFWCVLFLHSQFIGNMPIDKF